jgi:hypothetical protein
MKFLRLQKTQPAVCQQAPDQRQEKTICGKKACRRNSASGWSWRMFDAVRRAPGESAIAQLTNLTVPGRKESPGQTGVVQEGAGLVTRATVMADVLAFVAAGAMTGGRHVMLSVMMR